MTAVQGAVEMVESLVAEILGDHLGAPPIHACALPAITD